MNENEIEAEKNENITGAEKKEKSTMSVKVHQVSAGFIFLMGLFIIFSHGYVAGLLFIVAAYIAYEPKSTRRENIITSLSGLKRLTVVFLFLVVALIFLPNDNSSSSSSPFSLEPTTTPSPGATPEFTETSTQSVTDYQDNQWRETCLDDLSIVDEETKACAYAATNNDFTSLSSYADSLYADSKKTMIDSDLYGVSPDLQDVKNEYKLVMVQANLGAEWSIKGVDAYNSGNITAMQQDMETAKQNMEYYFQHLDNFIKLLSDYNDKHDN